MSMKFTETVGKWSEIDKISIFISGILFEAKEVIWSSRVWEVDIIHVGSVTKCRFPSAKKLDNTLNIWGSRSALKKSKFKSPQICMSYAPLYLVLIVEVMPCKMSSNLETLASGAVFGL